MELKRGEIENIASKYSLDLINFELLSGDRDLAFPSDFPH